MIHYSSKQYIYIQIQFKKHFTKNKKFQAAHQKK